MDAVHYKEMSANLGRLWGEGTLTGRRIFLFGHCEASEEMIRWLEDRGLAAEGILDNNSHKAGRRLRGVTVIKPEVFLERERRGRDSIVLIASRAYAEMSGQLSEGGYRGRIEQVVDYDSFSRYSLEEEVMLPMLGRMRRGEKLLHGIREECAGKFLVICPYNALGDTYYAMAYLPHYLRKINRTDYAVCVAGAACAQIAEMFGAEQTVILKRDEMDELVQAALYGQEADCIIAHHDRPYTDNLIGYLDFRFLSFADYYKCGVYGLPRETEQVLPVKLREFRDKERLEQGNTVIVSPYAKSILGVPDRFWRRVVEEGLRNGCRVLTNVAGEEKALDGTQPLSVPLDELVSAVEYAGYFVGIRSGLCDILSHADCDKTVVFPDVYYSTTPIKADRFFDLTGWRKIII